MGQKWKCYESPPEKTAGGHHLLGNQQSSGPVVVHLDPRPQVAMVVIGFGRSIESESCQHPQCLRYDLWLKLQFRMEGGWKQMIRIQDLSGYPRVELGM